MKGAWVNDTVIATQIKRDSSSRYNRLCAAKGESAFERSSAQPQKAIFIGHTNALGDGLFEVEGDKLA